MRKEIYEMLCEQLSKLYVQPDGHHVVVEPVAEVPEGWERAIKHIDLWNHNVEFIEQEDQWERPAVFVEFLPIQWRQVKTGSSISYTSRCRLSLHVVTDWHGSSSADSDFREKSLEVFDLLTSIHLCLRGMSGQSFNGLDLVESLTNHNHDELLENIEVYECVAFKSLR